MSKTRALPAAGVAVPILYFSTLLVSSWGSPGYSHLTQYASELGIAGAASARLFNGGIFLTGLAAILGSVGIYLAARREGAS